ncbi:type VI secretion system baseplate subunit TssF [Tautonia marina]|uniref:type VI secretion system baseplate subunit TssF n=1 Tax=Tautonia marina TaxID=2653855 RepID=UPI00126074F9|nr:type VI secretion system baseplate subunit TssF [Tautonia marina]
MNDTFLNYYNRELAFIREMGAEFAQAHPQVAELLMLEAGRCADPHVERLLEAFAFLAARLRKKIDDTYPELTDALLEVLYPHYQRPIPSMTIVQFSPTTDPSKIVAGYEIERGSQIVSRPLDGVRCQFRTVYPVWLWPVAIESATVMPDRVTIEGKPSGSAAMISLRIRCAAAGDWGSLEGFDRLRFFLDGGEPVPSTVYEALFNRLVAIWLRGRTASGEEQTISLGPDAVKPVGFEPDDGMVPYPERSFPGYRLLQEFFAFPLKFQFFDLTGLDRITDSGFVGPVEVMFFLDQPPHTDVTLRPENFRLGCSPAVNLFKKVAEPVRLDRLRSEYRLVPDVEHPLSFEVYSVDWVESVGSYLNGSVTYQPFYALRHADRDRGHQAYWFARRQPSLRAGDSGTDVELTFVNPSFSPTTPSTEKVTASLTCCNRDIPARLPFGGDQDVVSLEAEAPVGRVRLLTRPTKTLRPPLGRDTQWRAISALALNHLSLAESGPGIEALREVLAAYDFADSAVTRKQIGGITGVASRRIAGRTGNRLGKAVSLGIEIELTFDESAYSGATAFLMATVLERFLGSYVTVNSFSRLVARRKQHEGVWKRWAPRSGDRTLL